MIFVPYKLAVIGGIATVLGVGAVLTLVYRPKPQTTSSRTAAPSTTTVRPVRSAADSQGHARPGITVNGGAMPATPGVHQIPTKDGTATITVTDGAITVQTESHSQTAGTSENSSSVRVESHGSGSSSTSSSYQSSSSDGGQGHSSSSTHVTTDGSATIDIHTQ